MKVCGRPPPARKPLPVVHQEGNGLKVQALPGFSSLNSCGGSVIETKFWNFTSYEIPNPPRIAVLPLPVGSYANPILGPKLFLSVLGLWKSITPGTFEIALSDCVEEPRGLVQYS